MYEQYRQYNPGTAAVLSAIIPGLGQIYNGQFASATLIFFCLGIGLLTSIFLIGIPIVIGTYLFAVLGAYEYAARQNKRARAEMMRDKKKCPWCAEFIMANAIICRFCGCAIIRQVETGNNGNGAVAVMKERKI